MNVHPACQDVNTLSADSGDLLRGGDAALSSSPMHLRDRPHQWRRQDLLRHARSHVQLRVSMRPAVQLRGLVVRSFVNLKFSEPEPQWWVGDDCLGPGRSLGTVGTVYRVVEPGVVSA